MERVLEILVGKHPISLPKRRANRRLSRNARKAYLARVHLAQRAAADRRILTEATAEFTRMRLRERSFFSMICPEVKP